MFNTNEVNTNFGTPGYVDVGRIPRQYATNQVNNIFVPISSEDWANIAGSGSCTETDSLTIPVGGNTITEISTDGTLAGDSDDAIPTERAVKTYVDNIPSIGTSFISLTDTPVSYTSANALLSSNSVPDGLIETTVFVTEPAANNFVISQGTSELDVTTSCDIDQNLSTISTVTHASVVAEAVDGRTTINSRIELDNGSTMNASLNPSGTDYSLRIVGTDGNPGRNMQQIYCNGASRVHCTRNVCVRSRGSEIDPLDCIDGDRILTDEWYGYGDSAGVPGAGTVYQVAEGITSTAGVPSATNNGGQYLYRSCALNSTSMDDRFGVNSSGEFFIGSDSVAAALKILVDGTGNATFVPDSGNVFMEANLTLENGVKSAKFDIDTAGALTISTTGNRLYLNSEYVVATESSKFIAMPSGYVFDYYDANFTSVTTFDGTPDAKGFVAKTISDNPAHSGILKLQKAGSGGDYSGATLLDTPAGLLGIIEFSGYEGGTWVSNEGAQIRSSASIPWSTGIHPGDLQFFTSSNIDDTMTRKLRIGEDGQLVQSGAAVVSPTTAGACSAVFEGLGVTGTAIFNEDVNVYNDRLTFYDNATYSSAMLTGNAAIQIVASSGAYRSIDFSVASGFATECGEINFARSGGGSVTPSTTLASSRLGLLDWAVYDGTSRISSTQLYATASGTTSATNHGSIFDIKTIKNEETVLETRAGIDSDGRFYVGSDRFADAVLMSSDGVGNGFIEPIGGSLTIDGSLTVDSINTGAVTATSLTSSGSISTVSLTAIGAINAASVQAELYSYLSTNTADLGPVVTFRHYKPTAKNTQSGDDMGRLTFNGMVSDSWANTDTSAYVKGVATIDHTSLIHSAKLEFYTNDTTDGSPAQKRMTLEDDGTLTLHDAGLVLPSESISTKFEGAIPDTYVSLVLQKVGKQVTMTIPEVSANGTSSTSIYTSVALPLEYRPNIQNTISCIVQDGTKQMGALTIFTTGLLEFASDVNGGSFTSFGYRGWSTTTITWMST